MASELGRIRLDQDAAAGEISTYAEMFASSGLFNDVKGMAQCFVKICAGRELGMPPFASMSGIHLISGKVSLGGGLIAAAIKRSGRYSYRISKNDAIECAIQFREMIGGQWEDIGQYSFTIIEAKQAGLLSNPTWLKYPKAMLFNRAISGGARQHCPDIFGGPIYTPEELGADVDEHGDLAPVRPLRIAPIAEPPRVQARPEQAAIEAAQPDKNPPRATAAECRERFAAKANAFGFEGDQMRLASALLQYVPVKWTVKLLLEALDKPEADWQAAVAMLSPVSAVSEVLAGSALGEEDSSPFDDHEEGIAALGMDVAPTAPTTLPGAFAR